MELCTIAEEGRVEPARHLALLPALNQNNLVAQAIPIYGVALGETMPNRERRQQPIPIERQALGMRPHGMARRQDDIQAALFQRRGKVPIVHLRHRQHDFRVSFAPARQETDDRLPDRGKPNAEPNLTRIT